MPPTPPPRPQYPPRPVPIEHPPEAFRPPVARLSEAAARAAQNVLDLETDLAQAVKDVAQLKNLLQLEEERNKVLSSDLKSAQLDRDFYQRRNVEIMTKLTVAGSIVLDAMKEPPDRVLEPEQRHAINEAAQRALQGNDTLIHDPPEVDR